jgi:plastocyanin
MTNSLDSRFLQAGDCFGQRFSSPGRVHCFIGASAANTAPIADSHQEFLIEVAPKTSVANAAPKQVTVAVKSNGKGGLKVDAQQIVIEAGDGILFYASDPATGGFSVIGTGTNIHFDSSRIQNDAVYTHIFGTPGRFEWSDIDNPQLSGVVEVRPTQLSSADERRAWLETLKTPAVFEIRGAQCSPPAVMIVPGQTVFWTVTDSAGIAVVDRQLQRTRSSP